MTCSRCGKKSPEGAQVCLWCGGPLTPEAPGRGRGWKIILLLILLLAVLLAGVLGYYFYGRSHQGGGGSSGGGGSWGATEPGEDGPAEDETAETVQQGSGTLQDTFVKYYAGPLSVKTLPRGTSDTLATVNDYLTTLSYYGESAQGNYTWYKVRTPDGVEGWVWGDRVVSINENTKYLYPADGSQGQDYVKFMEDHLKVRGTPDCNGDLVCQVKDCGVYLHACYGDGVKQGPGEDGQDYDWIHVRVNGSQSGWVRADQVTPVTGDTDFDMDRVYVKNVSAALPLRGTAQQDGPVVTEVRKEDTRLYAVGDPKEETQPNGGTCTWYEVQMSSGLHGWVRSDQVKEITA